MTVAAPSLSAAMRRADIQSWPGFWALRESGYRAASVTGIEVSPYTSASGR